jgi:hypothetical protein
MIRPRRRAPVLMLAALLLAAAPAPAALALTDTPSNRRTQAERYEAVMSVRDALETSTLRVARMLPREHRQGFIDFAMVHLDHDSIRATVLVVLTETFTANELQAMADFFGSPVGRSVAGKMGVYTERVMPLMMMKVREAATAYARQQGAME